MWLSGLQNLNSKYNSFVQNIGRNEIKVGLIQYLEGTNIN